jgi:hypothetical protein
MAARLDHQNTLGQSEAEMEALADEQAKPSPYVYTAAPAKELKELL